MRGMGGDARPGSDRQVIDLDPSPTLVVQPTAGVGGKHLQIAIYIYIFFRDNPPSLISKISSEKSLIDLAPVYKIELILF